MLDITPSYNSKTMKKALITDACELCGYTKVLTRHRIRPGKSRGKYIPGNVISLCPNCHSECEMGLHSQGKLLHIVWARLATQKH